MIELAAVIDIGQQFVKSTYNLEGDGTLVTKCYQEIKKIRAAIQTRYHPNVEAVARSLSLGNTVVHQQWTQYAIQCVQPGIDYFQQKFGDDMTYPLNVFKAARYFSPTKMFEMQPSASDVDSLTVVPFLNDPATITNFKEELPTYLARTDDVSLTIDMLDWWKRNEEGLPYWSEAAKKMFLIQPSSAASERVFSLLNNSFGSRQNSSLQDYVEAAILLQYNNR